MGPRVGKGTKWTLGKGGFLSFWRTMAGADEHQVFCNKEKVSRSEGTPRKAKLRDGQRISWLYHKSALDWAVPEARLLYYLSHLLSLCLEVLWTWVPSNQESWPINSPSIIRTIYLAHKIIATQWSWFNVSLFYRKTWLNSAVYQGHQARLLVSFCISPCFFIL